VAEPGSTPFEPLFFDTPEQLRDWLAANHETAVELFVGGWKKATGRPSITWEQIVDEALCVGWIDSIRRGLPDGAWSQRLTPRRKGSNWSAINVAKIAELRAAGRLRPAGEAAFAQRREDRTAVYSFERTEDAALTAEEEARFRANEAAWAWFSARPPSYRKPALHWVVAVKRPETREQHLRTLIEDSAAGRPIKPLRWAREPAAAWRREPAAPASRAGDPPVASTTDE
jgi:uncharacterized protein YdeI (YjbR/CyaY-like superfamily)